MTAMLLLLLLVLQLISKYPLPLCCTEPSLGCSHLPQEGQNQQQQHQQQQQIQRQGQQQQQYQQQQQQHQHQKQHYQWQQHQRQQPQQQQRYQRHRDLQQQYEEQHAEQQQHHQHQHGWQQHSHQPQESVQQHYDLRACGDLLEKIIITEVAKHLTPHQQQRFLPAAPQLTHAAEISCSSRASSSSRKNSDSSYSSIHSDSNNSSKNSASNKTSSRKRDNNNNREHNSSKGSKKSDSGRRSDLLSNYRKRHRPVSSDSSYNSCSSTASNSSSTASIRTSCQRDSRKTSISCDSIVCSEAVDGEARTRKGASSTKRVTKNSNSVKDVRRTHMYSSSSSSNTHSCIIHHSDACRRSRKRRNAERNSNKESRSSVAGFNSDCSSSESECPLNSPLTHAGAAVKELQPTPARGTAAAGEILAADITAVAGVSAAAGITAATRVAAAAAGLMAAEGILAEAEGTPAARDITAAREIAGADLAAAAGVTTAAGITAAAKMTVAAGSVAAREIAASTVTAAEGQSSAADVTATAEGKSIAEITAAVDIAGGAIVEILREEAAAEERTSTFSTETPGTIDVSSSAEEAASASTDGERMVVSRFLRRRRWKAEKALLRYLMGMPCCTKTDHRRTHNSKNRSKHAVSSTGARDSHYRTSCALNGISKEFTVNENEPHSKHDRNNAALRKGERSFSANKVNQEDSCVSHSSCSSRCNSHRRSKLDSGTSSSDSGTSSSDSRKYFQKNRTRWKNCSGWGDSINNCHNVSAISSSSFHIISGATPESTTFLSLSRDNARGRSSFSQTISEKQEEEGDCTQNRTGEKKEKKDDVAEEKKEEGQDEKEGQEQEEYVSSGRAPPSPNLHHELWDTTALSSCSSSDICEHTSCSRNTCISQYSDAVKNSISLTTAREGEAQQQQRHKSLPFFSTSSNIRSTMSSRGEVVVTTPSCPSNEEILDIRESVAGLTTGVKTRSSATCLETTSTAERRERTTIRAGAMSTSTAAEETAADIRSLCKIVRDSGAAPILYPGTSQSSQLFQPLNIDEEYVVLLNVCRRWKILRQPAISSSSFQKKSSKHYTRGAATRRPILSQRNSTISSPRAFQALQKNLRLRQCFNFNAWRHALQKAGLYRPQQKFGDTPALALPTAAAASCAAATTAVAAVPSSTEGVGRWHSFAAVSDNPLVRAIDASPIQGPNTTGSKRAVVAKSGSGTAEAVVWDIPSHEGHPEREGLIDAATAATATSLATAAQLTAPLVTAKVSLASVPRPRLSCTESIQSVEGKATPIALTLVKSFSVERKSDTSSDDVICLTDNDDKGENDESVCHVNAFPSVQEGEFAASISTKKRRTSSVVSLAEINVTALQHGGEDETGKVQLERVGDTRKGTGIAFSAQDENQEVEAHRTDRRTALGALKYSATAHRAKGSVQEVAVSGENSVITARSRAKQKAQTVGGAQLQDGMLNVRAFPMGHSATHDVEAVMHEEGKVSIQSNVSRSVAEAPHITRARTSGWRWVGGEYDIWLILDVRERVTAQRSYTAAVDSHKSRGQYLFKQLQQNGVNVELRALPVGDALWVARKKSQAPGEQEDSHLPQLQLQLPYCREQSHTQGESHGEENINISEKHTLRSISNLLGAGPRVGDGAPGSFEIQLPSAARNNEEELKSSFLSADTSSKLAASCRLSPSSTSSVEYVLPFILERKTLRDLTASLRDGRYEEQKFRLLRCPGVKRIFYLIEGLLESSTYDAVPLLPLQRRHRSFLYNRSAAAMAAGGGAAAPTEDPNSLRRRQQAFHARSRSLHHVRGGHTLTQQERTSHAGNTQCLSSQQQLHQQELSHALACKEASRSLSSSAAAVASEIAALRTAQVKTQLVNGFTVLQTTGPAHTVAMLTRLHRRLKIHFACAAAEKRESHVWLDERDRLRQGACTNVADANRSSRRCVRPAGASSTLLVSRVSAGCCKKTHKPSNTSCVLSKRTLATCTRQHLHKEVGKGVRLSVRNTAIIRIADRVKATQHRKRRQERNSHTLDTSNLFLVSTEEFGTMTTTGDTSCSAKSSNYEIPALFFPRGRLWSGPEGGGVLELLRWDIWRKRSGEAMSLSVKEIFCRQLCALPSMGQRGAAYIAETCCNPAAFASLLDSTTCEKKLRQQLATTAAAIKEASLRKHLPGCYPRDTVANDSSMPMGGSSQERSIEENIGFSVNHQGLVLTNTTFDAAQDRSKQSSTCVQRSHGDPCDKVLGQSVSVACDKMPKTPERILAREERSSRDLGMAGSENASLERSTSRKNKQQGGAIFEGRTTQNASGGFSAPISAKAWALCRVMYQQAPPESALRTVRGAFLAPRSQVPQGVD